jgi:hypothetical protein
MGARDEMRQIAYEAPAREARIKLAVARRWQHERFRRDAGFPFLTNPSNCSAWKERFARRWIFEKLKQIGARIRSGAS